MSTAADNAVAIVGVGAILPDAADAPAFWENVAGGRYSISEVDPGRWDPALYFDDDPRASGRTYSKIGGWAREFDWDPLGWHLPIPPKVTDAMDVAQQWGVACTRMALQDYGWPQRPLDLERTAVVLGNAMAGEHHYLTVLRLAYPEIARELEGTASFAGLPEAAREAIVGELRASMERDLPPTTEDTMPGELGNCLAGRIANLFNLRGPNFVVDAACASAMAAMDASIEGLVDGEFDAVLTGGIDRNMGASSFIKFCAIGALSATGTRPYADGADGFVMGEGAALFVLKRLADAERDGDRVYAVVRGIAGSSDGKGKGMTAPNPIGQKLAIRRAWAKSGLAPDVCSLIEGHGTSTRVGDAVELESLTEAFAGAGLRPGSVALGSVKSNIGHLKAAAGAAGLLKAAFALHHKVLPPSLHWDRPNPNLDWSATPFAVNTELREWQPRDGEPRVAGVSAFGFGGTNFHAVLEEHVPGRLTTDGHASIAVPATPAAEASATPAPAAPSAHGAQATGRPNDRAATAPPPGVASTKPPLRGALVLGARDDAELAERLNAALAAAADTRRPPAAPDPADLRAPVRLAIDHESPDELAAKGAMAHKALEGGNPAAWKALRARGIFHGAGPAQKVAFLYTGQGSQYANMLADLRRREPVVAETFAEADAVMRPLLDGRALSDIIFVGPTDGAAVAAATAELLKTEITQPAVLTVDIALTRLLAAYGIRPDFVMGHSLGEYGALVAAGVLSFADALAAVSARGHGMAGLHVDDPGAMAAVSAPRDEVGAAIAEVGGYVVLANVNSTSQVVLGGATQPVLDVVRRLQERGHQATPLPVSHAFHTAIVAPASEPLKAMLRRLPLAPPQIPIVANVDGEFYPSGPEVEERIVEILGRQVASPVQFVSGLHTLFEAGARVFVEVGPKRALQGFASDVLGDDDVLSLLTNHPKQGDVVSFNQALCGLYASGHGAGADNAAAVDGDDERLRRLGAIFADALARGREVLGEVPAARPAAVQRPARDAGEPVVITGAALGLPGTDQLFDDESLARILRGEQFIDVIPSELRSAMVDRHITRLVKGDDGSGRFEAIDDVHDVIKLAGRGGALDLVAEFGVDADRVAALGHDTQLAIGAGIDALRDAGVPLLQHYRTTSKGTELPDRWVLPEALRDDTGVIFASAFPGLEEFSRELRRFWEDRSRREQIDALEGVLRRVPEDDAVTRAEIERRLHDLRLDLERHEYRFDRRFLFRILSMGHSQLAELIGARGPNTQVNAACASTTQAVALAEDWIRAGRCRRVVIVAADDATSDELLPWIGAGFLASGAAATDEAVEDAALPFDRRRHGMLIGMGAAGLVVESAEAARERGITPICEVLGTVTANSAFHGTRLDVDHIAQVMEDVVGQAEARGVDRRAIAPETVFVSHETYTPARGGSAAAEIHALRAVFGDEAADRVVIANTKGYTGHPMGVGIEDVVAVKALETGVVPPVPNFREVDPELGTLNLSQGGAYPVSFALRLAAGFGSQISMMLLRWTPVRDGRRRHPQELGFAYRVADEDRWQGWLRAISGQEAPELEVVQHRLRVVDRGAAAAPAMPREPEVAVPLGAPETAEVASAAARQSAPPQPPPEPEPTAAPEAAAPPEPAPEPESAAAPALGGVQQRVLELVALETGYPPDMLDLDLDLEADLGIDTVKQAEVFAAIREAYGIARDDSLKLRDYPTLNDVVAFVEERADGAAADPAAASETAAAPEPESAAAPALGDVQQRVLELVALETGYPPDMLDLDLDLEADLGIDTVKQAEVFAAIREAYGIARDDSLKLRDYPTLNRVVEFVQERAGAATPVTEPEAEVQAQPVPPEPDPELAARFPRRVPVALVRPPLDLCVPTGVTLGSGARVIVSADEGGAGAALTARLRDLGAEVLPLDPALDQDAIESAVAAATAEHPVHGVFWLAALDDEGALAGLDPDAVREALRRRVKSLAVTMRALPPEAFLVSATRLGGRHGYGTGGATSVLGGAVTGFTKALARERDETPVKAVDFGPADEPDAIAATLVDEALRDPGAVEVGHADGLRWTVGLIERDAEPDATRALTADTVFLVTGAAGSIVAAITADLARAAGGGTFHLLDLVPEPDAGDPDLHAFTSDREGLKRTLADRMRERGERPTPKLVERELARLERARAALDALEAIRAAGGSARWHQVDLADAAAVAAAVGAALEQSGDVDVLLHCAGVEISHFLPDKPQREYDLVFDVKALGWLNLLHALDGHAPGTAVVFSSIAGRFGNGGQTDYSAANDLCCKSVSRLNAAGATRAVAIDWTAWAGIGMATRGSIPTVMEAAGIDMLPPEVGARAVRRELAAVGAGGEVLVGGSLGVLSAERDPTGGIDPDAATAAVAAPPGPMTGSITAFTVGNGLILATDLDPERQAFLGDHRIDGTPVLPGVMGMEGFAEAAHALLPGWQVVALEDVDLLAPFKFYRDEPRRLELRALLRDDGEGGVAADCRLIGRRTLPGKGEQETLHFTGRARLARELPDGPVHAAPAEAEGGLDHDAVYRVYFHGPAYQVVERAWRADGNVVGRLAGGLPPDHEPPGTPTELAPRLVELCFQTAGLWEIGATGRLALPMHVDRLVRYAGADASGRVFAVVTPREDGGGVDAEVVDADGHVRLRLEGYRTIELPGGLEADAAAPIRVAMR